MKESYHICYTSHSEVMFRDREDHGMFVNLMALEAWRMKAEILTDAEMSTHIHQNVFTADPVQYGARLRMSYTKYFNRKYDRKGRMGEPGIFTLKVQGLNHQVTLNNYVLRNGQHHNASQTAFGYEFCSIREQFSKELGYPASTPWTTSRSTMRSVLPQHADFPDWYAMDENGVFLRSSFMEIRQVEMFYISPRNYLFQMNRLTDDSWIKDQEKDRTGLPIRIQDVEKGYSERDIAQMLNNEYGRNFRPDRMQDLDLCLLIDNQLLPSCGVTSIYQLSATKKQELARLLYHEFSLPEVQIRRCLALPPSPR